MLGRRHELKALERSRWSWSLVGVMLALVGAGAWIALPEPWKWGVPLALVAAAGVMTLVRRRNVRRMWRELLQADRRRCVRCFHDLRGLGEYGTCPECGERFIMRVTREEWLRVFQEIAQDGLEEGEWDADRGWWWW